MSLILRKIQETDLEKIMNWRTSPEVTQYMYTDPLLTMDSQKRWFSNITKDETCRYWVIKYENTDIGLLYLTDIDIKNKRCFWGYYIANTSFRGKGIARNIECNIYDYVFYKLNLHKICCEIFSDNEKVISIHERFGSEKEGLFKDYIYKNNKFKDVVRMGLLKDKWNIIRNQYEYENIIIED